jgi:hypothetical protein
VNQQDGPYEVEITDYHCGDSTMIKNGMRPIHPGEITGRVLTTF